MSSFPAFHPWGVSHVAALVVVAALAAGFISLARRFPKATVTRGCEIGLALALVAFTFGKLVSHAFIGGFDLQGSLPLHYCDMAALAGATALVTHRQRFCEIAYFFGLAGTLQGLITPALQIDYPSTRFWMFFGVHGAVVITALYVVLGLRRIPQPGAVGRAMMAMTLYAVVVAALNVELGTNYGFLCAKPPTASLMDYFGPWPWYVGVLWLAGLVFYLVLDLPFALKRQRG